MKIICSRCIYDSNVRGISFDTEGVCNFCHQIEEMKAKYGTGTARGEQALAKIISQIKIDGKNKRYDCVIGVSGGTDSSFLLHQVKEWGLKPLAVHYDNTWNSSMATENVRKITSYTDVDLFTYVINNKEADDIFRSFMLAGVPEFDASTDIAFAQVLRSSAAKFNVNYIIEGHSFIAEGISPMGTNYFDGRYIQGVHDQFGRMKMDTYPNLTFSEFMKWTLVYRQKFIRPLWYIEYSKPKARKLIEDLCDWTYYGGHHLENRSSSFLHTVYNPQKFNVDNRNWSLAAEVRSGEISRDEALDIYNTPIEANPDLIAFVKKRLGFSDDEYNKIMASEPRSWREFPTYKKRFEKMRPLFSVLTKMNLVPPSFYAKYCFPFKD